MAEMITIIATTISNSISEQLFCFLFPISLDCLMTVCVPM